MTRLGLLFLVFRLELDWRKGRIKIWIVEVVVGVAGRDTLLVVGRGILSVLELFPVDGVLLLSLLLSLQGSRVSGDVGITGVRSVATAHTGHAHTDLGPGAAHGQTVNTVVVVRVTCLARWH